MIEWAQFENWSLTIDMRDVSIIGIGQTKVGEHWDKSLKELATEAILSAIKDARTERVDSLYIGNMLSGELTGQEHLGALISDFIGLRGVEAVKIEAACGSGAAALRVGYIAVAGELADFVVVAGVEKMTDLPGDQVTAALATAAKRHFICRAQCAVDAPIHVRVRRQASRVCAVRH
jgi:acetyl-CoA C-acetyltransferase